MVGILSENLIRLLIYNAFLKRNLFIFLHINMIYAIKNKDGLRDVEELEDLQSKVKQLRVVEKLGKQGFHY